MSNQLYTFQTECGRKKISNKDGKVVAACMVRDIFDSALRLSLENSIVMAEVLQHPLALVHCHSVMLMGLCSNLLNHHC